MDLNLPSCGLFFVRSERENFFLGDLGVDMGASLRKDGTRRSLLLKRPMGIGGGAAESKEEAREDGEEFERCVRDRQGCGSRGTSSQGANSGSLLRSGGRGSRSASRSKE